MTETGMIFDTNSIKKQLVEANRDYTGRKIWENLYGSVNLAEQQQLNALKQDYTKAVSDAYASAYESKQAVAASNIGEGYKLGAMSDIDATLEEAYNSYRNRYLSGVSDVEASAASANEAISEKLGEQAEYTRQLANIPYDYLTYLFNTYAEGNDEDNIFKTNPLWSKYTYTDENGDMQLRSWSDIKLGNEQNNQEGMFDAYGNLTSVGSDFYDQMFNDLATKNSKFSFGNWLAENNSELFDWATANSPYAYTQGGTNLAAFKTLVGMKSTDEQYSFIERAGGLSHSQIDEMFSKFTDKAATLDERLKQGKSKDNIKEFEGMVSEIEAITDSLGITEQLENDIGTDLKTLAEQLSALANNAKGDWETALAAGGAGLVAGGSFVGVGAKTGLIATIPGAIATAVLAALAFSATTISTVSQVKKQNKALEQQANQAYLDLVSKLVEYSHSIKDKQSE